VGRDEEGGSERRGGPQPEQQAQEEAEAEMGAQ
jgi:hypothetical protein